jgi:hypothetical protein
VESPIDVVVVGPDGAPAVWDDLAELRRPGPVRLERPGAASWLAVASTRGRLLGYAHGRRVSRWCLEAFARSRWFADLGIERHQDWFDDGLEVVESAVRETGVLERLLGTLGTIAREGRMWVVLGPHETVLRASYGELGWSEAREGLLLAPSHPAVRSGAAAVRNAPEASRWSRWSPVRTRAGRGEGHVRP